MFVKRVWEFNLPVELNSVVISEKLHTVTESKKIWRCATVVK